MNAFFASFHVGKVWKTAKDSLNCAIIIALETAVYNPNELPNAGPGDAPKGALLGLGGGVNAFFCVVSCWQCVKNRKAGFERA